MNAGEQDSRTIGVRVVAVRGDCGGESGVVVAIARTGWYRIRWDFGYEGDYRAASVIPESQRLGNVRRLP